MHIQIAQFLKQTAPQVNEVGARRKCKDATRSQYHTCHSYRTGLSPQRRIKPQFHEYLGIRTRIGHQPIMPGLRCEVYHLVKL